MTQLTIEPIPTGWRAFYDPEGLTGEGKDREAAIVDLLDKTDERWEISRRQNYDLHGHYRDALKQAKDATDKLADVTRELADTEALWRQEAKKLEEVMRELFRGPGEEAWP